MSLSTRSRSSANDTLAKSIQATLDSSKAAMKENKTDPKASLYKTSQYLQNVLSKPEHHGYLLSQMGDKWTELFKGQDVPGIIREKAGSLTASQTAIDAKSKKMYDTLYQKLCQNISNFNDDEQRFLASLVESRVRGGFGTTAIEASEISSKPHTKKSRKRKTVGSETEAYAPTMPTTAATSLQEKSGKRARLDEIKKKMAESRSGASGTGFGTSGAPTIDPSSISNRAVELSEKKTDTAQTDREARKNRRRLELGQNLKGTPAPSTDLSKTQQKKRARMAQTLGTTADTALTKSSWKDSGLSRRAYNRRQRELSGSTGLTGTSGALVTKAEGDASNLGIRKLEAAKSAASEMLQREMAKTGYDTSEWTPTADGAREIAVTTVRGDTLAGITVRVNGDGGVDIIRNTMTGVQPRGNGLGGYDMQSVMDGTVFDTHTANEINRSNIPSSGMMLTGGDDTQSESASLWDAFQPRSKSRTTIPNSDLGFGLRRSPGNATTTRGDDSRFNRQSASDFLSRLPGMSGSQQLISTRG